MKYLKLFIGLLCGVLLASCKDDVVEAGAGALAEDEEVRVRTGVLNGLSSSTDAIEDFLITQTPDSFLLGEVHTDMWATIKADLMTQFACPVGFTFPEQSTLDSIVLVMTYTSWFAEGESPLRVSVYEMDKATFDYEQTYSSDEDVNDYWSGHDSTHVVKQDQIVVAAHPKDSAYSSTDGKYYPIVRFKMNDKFVDKMRTISTFPSQEVFNEFFKGLYITTTWGAATALYVDNAMMVMYYHYDYQGSTEPLHDAKVLYANSEVRQVNRYTFPNKQMVVDSLKKDEDSINYIISPGYVFTTLSLPLERYVDTLLGQMITTQGDTLQPYLNKALMRVEVLNVGKSSTTSDKWADPASDMLLIREDSLQAFFMNRNLPSSDYCLLGELTATLNSDYTYSYYYDFDVSTLLYNEVHNKMQHKQVEDVRMVMVPVHVTYSTSSSTSASVVVSQVKLNQTVTCTAIRSAQYQTNPLDIEVVFSGFTINNLH